MKSNKSLFIILTSLTIACSKDHTNEKSPVEGYWVGSFGFENTMPENPNEPNSIIFRNNGTLKSYYGYTGTDTAHATYKPEGTYILTGNSLTFEYEESGDIIKHKAVLTSPTEINGTWGIGPSDSDGGFISLTKQP